jgi:hypothetical protein
MSQHGVVCCVLRVACCVICAGDYNGEDSEINQFSRKGRRSDFEA